MNRIYKNYHQKIRLQKRIINNKNFTYINILETIDPYLKRKMKVLNIGCGVGTLDFYISNKVSTIDGIDISENAISFAKRNAKLFNIKNIKFTRGDVSTYKFKSKFDLIICSEIIEHVKDDISLIKKLAKLLKKDGIIFITTPLLNAPLNRLGLTKEFDRKVGHLRRYKIEELDKIIKSNNLKIVKKEYKEGLVRNLLFINSFWDPVIRVANKFVLISVVLNKIDILTVFLFGASGVHVVAKK